MVAEDLELLADFRADVAVVGVEAREVRLEGVDLVERELGTADPLDAAHHLDQPAAGGEPLLPQEQGLAPAVEHRLLRHEDAVAHERDPA